MLIPDAAHGTNPASVRLAGFDAVAVPADARGMVDVAALEAIVDEQVAGLMLTNPNTLGLFEEDIERITALIHGVGGLVYYDGANLNAILGRCRPGDMGFDIVHINTHKTFATPHGGGGPGAGPVGVGAELAQYLPAPVVRRNDDGTFGPLGSGAPALHRTPPRIQRELRRPGARLRLRVLPRRRRIEGGQRTGGPQRQLPRGVGAEDFPLAFPDERPMHEFVSTAKPLKDATGIRAMDVAKRMIDLGYHPSTVYFPLVVEEAMMVEPTETESKETLDGFAAAMRLAAAEARTDPDRLHEAPRHDPRPASRRSAGGAPPQAAVGRRGTGPTSPWRPRWRRSPRPDRRHTGDLADPHEAHRPIRGDGHHTALGRQAKAGRKWVVVQARVGRCEITWS